MIMYSARKFQTSFLAFMYLFVIQKACTTFSSKFGIKENKVQITETTDPILAVQIFKEFKVGDQNLVCRSIDGKTNRIWGFGICKQIIRKMYGNNSCTSTIINLDVKCAYMDYKYRKSGLSRAKGTILVADCGYRNIYVAHANQDYFYVFLLADNKFILQSCLEIKIQMNDYLPIEFKITDDPLEADNIFGFHGQGKFTDPDASGHVCKEISNAPKTIFADKICPFVFNKYGLQPSKLSAWCQSGTLKRYLPHVCDGCPKTSLVEDAARCWYSIPASHPKSLLIFNGPEKGYYYIGKFFDQQKGKRNAWSVISVIFISDLDKI